ncbi:MAG: hypothetical protein PHU13_00790, partial [Acholeplasmataceae bacterium]|nr:hypothetical protein [Acholeplasmataceae bacterium]
NLSFVNSFISGDITTEITTLRVSVPLILQEMMPEQAFLFQPGTESLMFIFGIVKMVINILLFIILLVLNFTIFKFISWILWKIVKPKKDSETGEKPKKRRLLGAGVGVIRGLILLLLLAIPMAGLASMASSGEVLMTLAESGNSGETQQAAETDDMDEMFAFFKGYRNTYVGQAFKSFDTKMFDSIVNISTTAGDKEVSIKLRKDLENFVGIYQILLDANEGNPNFDQNIVFKLTDDQITQIGDFLAEADIIKVGTSIAAEYLYDYLVTNDLLKGYETHLTLENLKAMDIGADIKKIAEAAILIRAIDFQEDIENNIFTLTEDQVTEIITKLTELQLLEYGLPIAINYFLSLEDTQTIMLDNGIDLADLVKPTPEELIADLGKFVDVYIAVKDLGYTSVEELKQLQNTENLELITDQQVTNLVSSIFGFNVLNDNSILISTMLYDMLKEGLPEDYQSVITLQSLQDNFNETEVTNLVLLTKLFLEVGIFEENFDYENLFTEDIIEKLASRISGSSLISGMAEGLITTMTSSLEIPFEIEVPPGVTFGGAAGKAEIKAVLTSIKGVLDAGLLESTFDAGTLSNQTIEDLAQSISDSKIMTHNIPLILDELINNMGTVTIEIPEDFSFAGEAGKNELIALFKTFRTFTNAGFLDSDFDITTLSDTTIRDIAIDISSSVIMTNNINNFMNNIASGTSFDFLSSTDVSVDWDEDEVYYTLNAAKIFMSNNITESNINSLSNSDIHMIAMSEYVSTILGQTVINMNEPGGTLDGKLSIPTGIVWHSTDTTTGELENLFLGIKELLGTNDLSTFNPTIDSILNLDHNLMFESLILESTIVNEHIKPTIESGSLEPFINNKKLDNTDYQWMIDRNMPGSSSDSLDFLLAIRDLVSLGINYNNLTYEGFVTLFEDDTKPKAINDVLVKSELFAHSFGKMFGNLLTPSLNISVKQDGDEAYWGSETVDGELLYMLEGLFAANDLKSFNFPLVSSATLANDKNKMEDIVVNIYDSLTLRQLLINLPTTALSPADHLRRDPDPLDPMYKAPEDLSKAEWVSEVDIILEVLVVVNEGYNLSESPSTPEQMIQCANLITILSSSILYDSSNLILIP